jgi:transposase
MKNYQSQRETHNNSSERWMDIHILRQQGLSIRKIAALRSISRNAVRRALRSTTPPSGKRCREKGFKLAPFTGMIDAWLSDPVTSLWTTERIFDELQERGYDGGCTVVREYVRPRRPKPPVTAEARFLVKPGQQVQIDWAEMGATNVGGLTRKVYAFVAILAWSRTLFVRFTTDMELLTWLDCHRSAFAFFGGVPEEALIDNLKTGVISRAGKTVRWNAKYEELAVAMGFRPLAHFPLRPKTKGRVERIVRFVRERFFVGREIADLEAFNAQAQEWLTQRANRRVHRVTRQRPCDRFEIERKALRTPPEYDLFLEEQRVADAYALVSFKGARYSVPAHYARQAVTLHCRPQSVSFLVDGQVVAVHPYAAAGARLMQNPEHLPPQPKPRHERFHVLACAVIERFGTLGEHYVAAVEKRAPHAPLAILREVLERDDEYERSAVTACLDTLLQLGLIKHGVLSTLCRRLGATPKLPTLSITDLPCIDVEQRSLAVYDEVAA